MNLGGPAASVFLPGGPGAQWTTLDAVFQRNAARHPDRLALVDDPDRSMWNRTAAVKLTYAEAEQKVAAIAAFFEAEGLRPDSVIALDAPNVADTVLVFLAALRAGLIVAPLPPLWRKRDSIDNLRRLAPAAVVTTGIVEGEAVGARLLEVAETLPTVGTVYGFGDKLPAGVTDLARLGSRSPPPARQTRATAQACDDVATVSMSAVVRDGTAQYHARSHTQWLAAGLTVVIEGRLTEGVNLLMPYSLSGIAGIGAGLVPWLLTAGTLNLHHFSGLRPLVVHAAAAEPGFVVLPGPLAEPLISALTRRSASRPATLGAVWKGEHPEAQPAPLPSAAATRFVDITVLDELAIIPRRRSEGAPAGLPIGSVGFGADAGAVYAELRVDGRLQRAGDRARPLLGGTLAVRSPALPISARLPFGPKGVEPGFVTDPDGFVRTDIACRLSGGAPALLTPIGREGDILTIAGIPVMAPALDALYAGQPGVREAAGYLAPATGGRSVLRAALVMEPGRTTSAGSFRQGLGEAGAALHHMPDTITIVTALPRTAEGRVDRVALAIPPPAEREPVKAAG